MSEDNLWHIASFFTRHGYEFDYGTKNGNWERLERFFETISGKQDIVYATKLKTVLAIQQ